MNEIASPTSEPVPGTTTAPPDSGAEADAKLEAQKRPKQLALFPYQNPFRERMPRDFFRSLPRSPGVYRFFDEEDELLYVGKSKDLRARVSSYARARPGEVGRKVIRLVDRIRRVEWETTTDECEALLLENALLRRHDPPFNEANTRPDTYFFLGVRAVSLQGKAHVRIRITTRNQRRVDTLYGAFKGRGRVIRAFFSILRVAYWNRLRTDSGLPLVPPRNLQGGRIPPSAETTFPPGWLVEFREYLEGKNNEWLAQLENELSPVLVSDPFVASWFQADLQTLRDFYDYSLSRNAELSQFHGQRLLPQDRIDDFIVLNKFRNRQLGSMSAKPDDALPGEPDGSTDREPDGGVDEKPDSVN